MKNSDYQYKISVVIPIYNTEDYLKETINSVIKQTIGFKENIQLILVNDGSSDNSEKICLEFQKKYPSNIKYFYKKNEGVSVARNYGKKYAEGKYINFLDSDDKFDLDAYKKAYKMLEENNDIDVVTFRLKYFEASKNYHHLDYKFDGDRIINVDKEPQNILLHMSPSIIRSSALKDKEYDARLAISEDTKLLYQIILEKGKYGIISSSNYNYRKRKNGTSAIQQSKDNVSWYIDTFKYCQDELIEESLKKYGKVIPYVQHFIMYELQWRLKTKISEKLTEKQKKEYVEKIANYLKLMDDEVIIFQKNINIYYKLLIFKIKYVDIMQHLSYKKDGIYINNSLLAEYDDILNTIEMLSIKNNNLIIEGHVFLDTTPFELYYKIDGKRKKIDLYDRKAGYNIFDENNDRVSGYTLNIPLKNIKTIEFEIEIDKKIYPLINEFIHYSLLNNFKAGYYYYKKYLITKSNDKRKIIIKYKPLKLNIFFKEIYYLLYILIIRGKLKVVFQRVLYFITKPFMPKNIWLFADREFMAHDSAEVLFRYTNSQENNDKRTTYFVVDKSSPDFDRMKKYGRVVSYHTLKYKLLFLNAKFLISSHFDGYVNNEFGNSRKFYIDLYRFKYIYLTHGVLLHDSSAVINRFNKNIELYVVSGEAEYQSFLDGDYYYSKDQLIKTGIPRHDNLFNEKVKEENKILIMASWRSKLAGQVIKSTQRRMYNPTFKESEYFKFYDRLFKDTKLHKILKEYNYKIKFCIHPSFRAQLKDFKGNEFVEIAIDVDSQYETLSSKFLITDYSSAACDFAVLRKPVIYANFDYDHIYDIHYYNKGYFDYDRDGFGPNCKTYDDTINEIIKLIKNDGKMDKKYMDRCDKFFYHHDNKNAKRVYDEIIEYEKNNRVVRKLN